ncbi:MAG: hypothetical protein VXY71_06795, partial [Pseudomonadota bacterium]|nr:hypothetical protein [Pseudomonadota bacterium]MEC8528929.1 hypothetical protein [Pseudomonadota bacterium]MED6300888.1 hypothetical protein [Pseudomonadota bacterium]
HGKNCHKFPPFWVHWQNDCIHHVHRFVYLSSRLMRYSFNAQFVPRVLRISERFQMAQSWFARLLFINWPMAELFVVPRARLAFSAS